MVIFMSFASWDNVQAKLLLFIRKLSVRFPVKFAREKIDIDKKKKKGLKIFVSINIFWGSLIFLGKL